MSNFTIIILVSTLFSLVYKERQTYDITVCVFSLAIAAFVIFYLSLLAFCCVFVDYSGLCCNCASVNESKLSPNVVVKLKEAIHTAHRYCRIICLLLMGIVLNTEMVGSLKCTLRMNVTGINHDMSALLCA
jgi:hypothetical protein